MAYFLANEDFKRPLLAIEKAFVGLPANVKVKTPSSKDLTYLEWIC